MRKSKDGSKHITDEKINSITHLVGAILSVLAVAILIVQASLQKDVTKIVSFSLYGFSLFSLFLFSTLHHSINSSSRVEKVLKVLDYNAVFLLIAGTITPLSLIVLTGALGWTFFGVIWILAIIGISLKSINPHLPKWVTNTFYITMGWLGFFLAISLFDKISLNALYLLAFGGILYSVGFAIYTKEWPNLIKGKFGFHEIWHILVLVAAGLHWLMYYLYVL